MDASFEACDMCKWQDISASEPQEPQASEGEEGSWLSAEEFTFERSL